MRILEGLAGLFINTFGITQPTDEARRKAAWFILALLILALIAATTVGLVVYHIMSR